MTFHSFVLTYGQRRGYAMADLHRIVAQQSSLFSNDASTINDPPITVSLASDLMLNLSEPSVYLNELQLFASFYNSLPVALRRRLQSYTNGAVSYFVQKLSRYGHPPDILASALEEFQSPKDSDTEFLASYSGAVNGPKPDELKVLKTFLTEFRLPLLNEYFHRQTSLLLWDSDRSGDSGNGNIDGTVLKAVKTEEEDLESETEDGSVEDPLWWTPVVRADTEEDDQKKQMDDLDITLAEIREICAKLPSCETGGDESFPFAMKMYNFSSEQVGTRGRYSQGPSAVCAEITSDGRLACFGCDSDSSIRCFPIRRYDASSKVRGSSSESPFTLRSVSSSGIIYRLALLESSIDGQFLLSASDDQSRPVQLFDLASGSMIYDYRGHQWPAWALDSIAHSGGMFVTGSYDRTARLFLLDRRDPIRVFVGHESSVDCVQFVSSPEVSAQSGKPMGYPPFIATASSDGTVRLWSLADAIAVRVFHGIKSWPTALAYRSGVVSGSSENLLACATTEGKIFIWELESGRTYQILEGVLANDLQFTSDGRYLMAGGDGGCFKIYRLSFGAGEFGNQYVEMQISENLLFHNIEAKFLKIKFIDDEVVCLTA